LRLRLRAETCEAPPPLPCVVAQDTEEHGREDRPHQDDDGPRERDRAEEAAVSVIRRPLTQDSVGGRGGRWRRREIGRLPRPRWRTRREGRRRRRRRSPRAIDPRVRRDDSERGQEASVHIAAGVAAAIPVAELSRRGRVAARIAPRPGLGDVAAAGEHEAVATLGPRVASLTRGQRRGGWRGKRRRVAWRCRRRRRRRRRRTAVVEALGAVVNPAGIKPLCPIARALERRHRCQINARPDVAEEISIAEEISRHGARGQHRERREG